MAAATKRGRRTTSKKSAKRPAKRVFTPKVLVLRAPGTNCDRETAFAFKAAGAVTASLHVNALLKDPKKLRRVHGLAIPGGFSHGDDLGAGTVLGAAIRTKLRDAVLGMVDRGGIVLGICNGFQVLAKTGLLPGFADDVDVSDRRVSLASNKQNRYEDRWVTLEAVSPRSVFFRPGDRIHCPVAHAEGRVVVQDETIRRRLHDEDHVALRYVDPSAKKAGPVPFPHNPNGSLDDIAGLCDHTGRILGLMPHPERNQFAWQDPRFHGGTAPKKAEGMLPFVNSVKYLKRKFG